MRYLILFFWTVFAAFPNHAQTTDALIQTDASHAVILDHETGAVLFAKNGEELMIPASMTKMMTVQLIFDRLRRGEISLTDTLVTSQNAWEKGGFASGGSTMGLAIDDAPTIEELLLGIIVLSGNDACIVAAEGLSGTEALFASEMTGLARDMGLETATFKNATGLNQDGHRISAIDLARLASLQIKEFPEYYQKYYPQRSYEWRGIRQPNRNRLLGKVDGVDGLKTGHLEASGYGITVSAKRDGERRIVLVNGLDSEARREQEATRLLRIAFTAFETRTIEPSETSIADVPVWLGVQRTLPVGVRDAVSVSGHKRAFENATSEIVYNGPLEAPISKGTEIGQLIVTVPGQAPVSTPVVALVDVQKLGFIGRIAEGLSRMMANDDE